MGGGKRVGLGVRIRVLDVAKGNATWPSAGAISPRSWHPRLAYKERGISASRRGSTIDRQESVTTYVACLR